MCTLDCPLKRARPPTGTNRADDEHENDDSDNDDNDEDNASHQECIRVATLIEREVRI